MDAPDRQQEAARWLDASRLDLVTAWANPRVVALCPAHQHPCHELVVHPRGRGHSRLPDGRRLAFAPGDLVWYPPGLEHDQRLDEAGEDWCIQLDLADLPPLALPCVIGLRGDAGLLADLRALVQDGQARGGLGRARALLRARAALAGVLEHALAGAAAEGDEAGARHAAALHRHLAERFRDPGRLAAFAAARGIGEDHLRHCFTRRYGLSPVQWLARVRVERAQELLLHSDLDLAGIAADCGLGTARYLCTVFRRQVGCTPGAFRRR